MIDSLEVLRGHRVKVHTLDTGNATGTLGTITYTDEGVPISLEVREPDDVDGPYVVVPWTSTAGIEPLIEPEPEPAGDVFEELPAPEHGGGRH